MEIMMENDSSLAGCRPLILLTTWEAKSLLYDPVCVSRSPSQNNREKEHEWYELTATSDPKDDTITHLWW